jgi:hypothetical protein
MKRLWLIPPLAAAALAAGCGSKPPQGQGQGAGAGWQSCTDQQGRIVDDAQCAATAADSRPGYRWYYYPFVGRPYPIGWGVPLGGSYSNTPHQGVPRASVVRGGFGATGSGSSVGS